MVSDEKLGKALLRGQTWEGFFDLNDPVHVRGLKITWRPREGGDEIAQYKLGGEGFSLDENGNPSARAFHEEILSGIDPKDERGHRIASMQHATRLGIDPQRALEMMGLDKGPPAPEELAAWPAWGDKEAWSRLSEEDARRRRERRGY
jgi:hypothetical protein